MATITIGSTADAVTNLVPRIGNMAPGGGHDAGYQFLFDGGAIASNGVNYAEAYYAMANNRIHVSLPTMNGFSTAVSYTPAMEFNSSDGIGRTAHATADTSHGETASLGISYSGEMEGMSYTIGVGTHQGNSQGVNRRDDNVSTNNDLSSWAGAIQVTMGNIVMGIHGYDDGDSWGGSTDADKASNSGYTVSATYAMGNITVGVGYAHQERMRGTRAAQVAEAAGTAGQKREDSVTMFGIGKLPKIPGSYASLVTVIILYILFNILSVPPDLFLYFLVVIFIISLISVNVFIKNLTNKDPKEIVIDEFIGQSIPICLYEIAHNEQTNSTRVLTFYFIMFILFRIFDITKPYPVSYYDKNFKNSFGVIMDDVCAGLYVVAILVFYMIIVS